MRSTEIWENWNCFPIWLIQKTSIFYLRRNVGYKHKLYFLLLQIVQFLSALILVEFKYIYFLQTIIVKSEPPWFPRKSNYVCNPGIMSSLSAVLYAHCTFYQQSIKVWLIRLTFWYVYRSFERSLFRSALWNFPEGGDKLNDYWWLYRWRMGRPSYRTSKSGKFEIRLWSVFRAWLCGGGWKEGFLTWSKSFKMLLDRKIGWICGLKLPGIAEMSSVWWCLIQFELIVIAQTQKHY